MKNWDVTITETLARTVSVEAASREDAEAFDLPGTLKRNIYTNAQHSGTKVENQTRKFIECSGECSANVPPMFRGMFRLIGSRAVTDSSRFCAQW